MLVDNLSCRMFLRNDVKMNSLPKFTKALKSFFYDFLKFETPKRF